MKKKNPTFNCIKRWLLVFLAAALIVSAMPDMAFAARSEAETGAAEAEATILADGESGEAGSAAEADPGTVSRSGAENGGVPGPADAAETENETVSETGTENTDFPDASDAAETDAETAGGTDAESDDPGDAAEEGTDGLTGVGIDEAEEDLLEEAEDGPADLSDVLNGAVSGTIRSGVYSIATAADPDYVLSAQNDSIDLRGNVALSLNSGREGQLFYVAALGGGKYRIENLLNGYVLDSAGGGTEKGTNIQQYRVNSTAAQTFKVTETSSGLYTIAATHCSLVLDVEAGLAAEDTNVRLWRSNGTAAQKWIFTKVMDPVPSGLYYLTNTQSGTVMQVAGGSYSIRANIEAGAKTGAVSQRFYVRSTNGGATYTINNFYSRLTLDVAGGSKASGTNIQQYRINGTEAQTFRITPLLEGGCRISSMLGSLPLAVDGTNVCQQSLTQAADPAQTWTFEQAPADPAEGMYRILSAKNASMGLDIYSGDWNIRTNVQLYTSTTSNSQVNQQFILTSDGSDSFTITNVGSGKVLDKAGGAENMSEENVQQYRPNGTTAQKWRFVATGDNDGSFYIINGVGTYLDVKGGTMANGTNIQSHRGNKTAAQKWYLEPTAFSGTGWRTVNTYERSYYKNGIKLTGWQKIGGDYYYFDKTTGIMKYSCTFEGYQLDASGRRHTSSAAAILSGVAPGGKTLKNLIQHALMPCGRVLYIWGGGWGDSDMSRIGYLSSWGTFFKANATATYNRNNYRYAYGCGLDCSGYMAWVVYNTEFTRDKQFNILYQGSTPYTSTTLAQRIASLGYATYRSGAVGSYTALKPGDIVSMDGHIWMYLGSCPDGSGVIIHSSPMGQTYGGGVQLAGTTDAAGNRNSQGYRLADAYMKKYFSDWPYVTNVCSVSYRSSAVGYARWKSDPDGIQAMSAEQVLKTILGNV